MGSGAIANRGIRMVRQPFTVQWTGASWHVLSLIPILLGILAVVVMQQQQAGLLTLEAGRFVARLIGFFLVLPGWVGILIVRSPWFQQFEAQRCSILGHNFPSSSDI